MNAELQATNDELHDWRPFPSGELLVLVVVSELLTNAVSAASVHAELRATVTGGRVLLEVLDDVSTWHLEAGITPVSAGGYGSRLAVSLCEDLHVASSPAGTVIRARVGSRWDH